MEKRWRFHPHDAGQVHKLEEQARISPIVAQLLIRRGISRADDARRFLDAKLTGLHDPELLPGLSDAADRIHAALAAGRKIAIYGDYDADGMTGTATLCRCLRMLGTDPRLYVPNRLNEGYGLNDAALDKLAEDGVSLVISVDCGIASIGPAATARRLGLELIVTDHHDFADQLPDAAAIVHPRLPGGSYPFGELCGAGVAFKLAWALCCRASGAKRVGDRMRSFLLTAVGLTALGTVADVVPLLDENRILVREGLKCLRERPLPGLAALMRVAKLADKPTLSSEDIAFSLAPRLNAAGRLGQAPLGVELLTTDSADRAEQLAAYIDEFNQRRDSLERSVYLAANKQIKDRFDARHDPAFVLSDAGWHAGVIGIVAGRLAEKYHRPVILISFDEVAARHGTGSGRSACGLDLHHALACCGEHLLTHGGHAAAAGLRIEPAQVDRFREAFCNHAATHISATDRIAEITIDAEAPLSQLTLRTVEQVEQIAPFGAGNPRPVLCATGVQVAAPPRHLGNGERHMSVQLAQHGTRLRAIGFGRGEWVGELNGIDRPLDVAYRPVINEFQGRRSVELHLVDWRLSTSPVARQPVPSHSW